MSLSKTFKVSGLLTAAGVLLVALPKGSGHGALALGIVLLCFAGSTFLVSATRALLRGLLWRVGSRLVVSYLLLMSAVAFAAVFVYAGLLVVAGQLGTRRVEAALESHRAVLRERAQELARSPVAPGNPAAGDLPPRPWMTSRASVVAKSGGDVFAAAIEPRTGGALVLRLPLDSVLRRELERETGNVIRIHGAIRVSEKPAAERKSGARVSVNTGKKGADLDLADAPDSGGETTASAETAAPPAGKGPWSARWTAFPLFLSEPVLDWETGQPLKGRPVLILVRTSLEREAHALFGDLRVAGSERLELSRAVLGVMGGLGIATVVVFFLASLLAALLVSRIARATRRLSTGFAEIEKGNFAHRMVLKGHDQLAALAGSFNHMAGRLSASVAERAEREALEHELSVARDLQQRLLPPADFACPGVGIAVDFAPAAAIGGDFYDLSYAERVLTVSVADVSGHGLPTGLVMAAAKASLGMLARTGAGGVKLMELLHEEIVRTTDRRTFVTLCHLVFDLARRTVAYTNAGHPYPYRIQKDGTVRALQNPARPLGLSLTGGWHTIEEPLAAGDFWVVFSDGLVEATRLKDDGTGEAWSFERLEEVLRAGPAESAAALKERILGAQSAFTGRTDTEDDRTLLVLRIEERGATP